jgi:hypothetical protein
MNVGVQFTGNELAEFKSHGELKRLLAGRARMLRLSTDCSDDKPVNSTAIADFT